MLNMDNGQAWFKSTGLLRYESGYQIFLGNLNDGAKSKLCQSGFTLKVLSGQIEYFIQLLSKYA